MIKDIVLIALVVFGAFHYFASSSESEATEISSGPVTVAVTSAADSDVVVTPSATPSSTAANERPAQVATPIATEAGGSEFPELDQIVAQTAVCANADARSRRACSDIVDEMLLAHLNGG